MVNNMILDLLLFCAAFDLQEFLYEYPMEDIDYIRNKLIEWGLK